MCVYLKDKTKLKKYIKKIDSPELANLNIYLIT